MPQKTTVQRAKQAARQGKRPTTQAGGFVREEMEHVRRGKHGARSPKQAIAIGLSKARRSGVPLPPPPPGRVSEKTRRQAEQAYHKGQEHPGEAPSRPKYSRIRREVLKREPRSSSSRSALSRQARQGARRRRAAG